MFAWWKKLNDAQKGRVLQGLALLGTLITVACTLYQASASAWNWYQRETVYISVSETPVKHVFDEDFAIVGGGNITDEEWQKCRYKSDVSIHNRTSKPLKNVTVRVPEKEGLYIVSLRKGKTLEAGRFEDTLTLKNEISPLAYHQVTFWYTAPLTKSVSVSTDPGGVSDLPRVEDNDLVRAWYRWAFWLVLTLLIMLGAWNINGWIAKKYATTTPRKKRT